MSNSNLLLELARYVFPAEIFEFFELTDIQEFAGILDLYFRTPDLAQPMVSRF